MDGRQRMCCILTETVAPDVSIVKSLQTNYIGTALLAIHLLPLLLQTPHEDPFPRLVFVGSEVHYFISQIKQDKSPNILVALNNQKTAVMSERYYVSKGNTE